MRRVVLAAATLSGCGVERQWAKLAEQVLRADVLVGASVLSVALALVSLLGITWAVRRLPADFLLHDRLPPAHGVTLVGRVLRNALGAALLVLGVLMLALPGQGLLTIVVALSLLEFPGKRRLERRVVRIRGVHQAINRLRERAGRPPLLLPPEQHRRPSRATGGGG